MDEVGCDHGRTPQAMTLAGFTPQKETWGHAPVIEITVVGRVQADEEVAPITSVACSDG